MQHFILIIAIILLTSLEVQAQCDKKITWYATHEELLDTNGTVLDQKTDTVILVTTKDSIHLKKKGDAREAIDGSLKESTSKWSDPFKNGKSFYKTVVSKSDDGNDSSDASITIVGKDGKITVTLEIDKMEGKKIRILVDNYEEK